MVRQLSPCPGDKMSIGDILATLATWWPRQYDPTVGLYCLGHH